MDHPPLFYTGEVAAQPTEGAFEQSSCQLQAPSAMLRTVPLPRFAGEDDRMRSPSPGRGEGVGGYVRLMASGPGAWQVGIISMRLMLTCSGSPTSQPTVSAMSSAVSGTVPL